ncbi:exopolysaccharide biosynthesis protein [Siphonobacter sp. SORGH_AS 1065]|nr:exopolysaccharide biosynthesis protein [Siphonobacter sp. SORGH_AS_1065]
MKSTSFLILCWIMLTLPPAVAQHPFSADSVALLKATWNFLDVAPGVTWKQAHLKEKELFHSNQNINILDTKLKNRRVSFGFVSADTPGDSVRKLIPTSDLLTKAGAVAAVNGTFFFVKQKGSEDQIKLDGVVLDSTFYTPGKPLMEHKQAAITIRKRKVTIERAPTSEPGRQYGWDKKLNAPNVMVTGPLLVWDGETVPLQKNAFNDNRHPRTAACITREKHLILLTADGRNAQAEGLSLHELAFLLKQLRCERAVNLDGGGSSTMVISGQPYKGVVNMPSDNKMFDHLGERPVSNAIYIRKK